MLFVVISQTAAVTFAARVADRRVVRLLPYCIYTVTTIPRMIVIVNGLVCKPGISTLAHVPPNRDHVNHLPQEYLQLLSK